MEITPTHPEDSFKHVMAGLLEEDQFDLKKIKLYIDEYETFLKYNPDLIVQIAAEAFGVSAEDIKSRSYKRTITDVRFAVMYLMRTNFKAKSKWQAKYFRVNHTNVSYGTTTAVPDLLQYNKEFAEKWNVFVEKMVKYQEYIVFEYYETSH